MKAFAALFSALVLGYLCVAPTASATRPFREFVPNADTVISGVCSFEVELHIIRNNEYALIFDDGHVIVTGLLIARLTNLSDPTNSTVLNISGPGTFTPTADDGFVLSAEGPWLFWFMADQLYPGSPAIFVFSRGHSILSFDGSGTGTFSPARNSIDMCAALS